MKRAPLLLIAALMLGLGCRAPRNPLAEWLPSPNHNPRRPLLVVLHHTVSPTFESSLKLLQTRNDGGPVSAHYLIDRSGRIGQLVAEDQRAWHAGTGTWGPYRDLNSLSLGIELVNTGAEPFPKAQIDALLTLLEDITRRYGIPRTSVVGHGDVEPVRKEDPSALFPWRALAERGFGLWPEDPLPEVPPCFDPFQALAQIGYGLKDRAATVRAFRRHFRGEAGDALDDTDLRILVSLQRTALRLAPNGVKTP